MNINLLKITTIVFASLLMITSCDSDDDNSEDEVLVVDNSSSITDCPTIATDQIAQGNFLGESFISPGGSYRDQSFGGDAAYLCRIYVKSPLDTEDCIFPEFGEGDQDTILFSINSLEPQSFDVTDVFSLDSEEESNTLSFNRVTEEEGITMSELSCGVVTITAYDDETGEIQGTVVAKGVDGSNIDGNFVLDFCDEDVF